MISEEKKEWAAQLLRQKEKELERTPKKDDFDEETRSRIKAFLGPWPRALEAAGLKEVHLKTGRPGKRKKNHGKDKRVNSSGKRIGSQPQKGETQ